MIIKKGFKLYDIEGQWLAASDWNTTADNQFTIKLNSSAALLWRELEKGVDSVDDLARLLIKTYEIDFETALRDCEELIGQLERNGLLEDYSS